MLWIIVLHGIWILAKGIHFIYLLEKKQYRLHRFQSMIHDRGFFMLFYSLNIRVPSKSIRNLLIAAFHLLVTGIIILYSFENMYLYDFLSYYILLAPFVAFMIVISGVLLTQIPVYLYQRIIMQLAAWRVRRSKARFIAVTGSYGKSDVVYYLKEILSKDFHVAATEENMNTEMGIAQSVLRHLKQDTEIMIIEAATYSPGQILRETSYIPFTSAILTGIGNQHIDLFPSHDALTTEESSIVQSLPAQARAYINESVPNREELTNSRARIQFYGFSSKSNITCRDYQIHTQGSSGRISYQDIFIKAQTSLLGRHTLQNLLPVVACAIDLGIKPHEVRQSIQRLNRRAGRLSVHRGKEQAVFILDDVDPSIESVKNGIDLLRRFPQQAKYMVLSPLTERGGERVASYEEVIAEAQMYNVTLLLLRPGHGIHTDNESVKTFNDVNNLYSSLISELNKGTVILIEGMFPQKFTESLLTP